MCKNVEPCTNLGIMRDVNRRGGSPQAWKIGTEEMCMGNIEKNTKFCGKDYNKILKQRYDSNVEKNISIYQKLDKSFTQEFSKLN